MGEKNKRQDLIIKICCIIVSFALWLYIYNIENPIKETKMTIPVNLINKNATNNLVLIPNQNNNVEITIRGNVKNIYSIKPEQFKLESDLKMYSLKKGENKIPVYIKKSPNNIKIVNENSLWVNVILDKVKVENVPIKSRIKGEPKKGYVIIKSTINQDTAQISGIEGDVNRVKEVVAFYDISRKLLTNSSINNTMKVLLKPLDDYGNIVRGVEVKPSEVDMQITLKKTKNIPINLRFKEGIKSNKYIKQVKLAQSFVEVFGEDKIIDSLKYIDTDIVDINEIKPETKVQAKLLIPKGVTLVRNNPYISLNAEFNEIDNKTNKKDLDQDIITKTINKNVEVLNKPSNKEVYLDKDTIIITVKGKKKHITEDILKKIKISVDAVNLNVGEHNVPLIVKVPKELTKVSVDTSTIKIIIKSNQEDKYGVNS